jgi:dTMP kinase
MAGCFVVIEGLDGAGTTTQVALLAQRLAARGHEVLATREPTDGPVGRAIRATLRAEDGAADPTALPWLFAAARAEHHARVVEPATARDAVVISDRYYHSSLAYQSAALGLHEVWLLNRRFRTPDVTVLVEVPVDVALDRIARRGGEREIFEHRAKLGQVTAAYRDVLSLLRGHGQRIDVVDGTGTPEAVATQIAALVVPVVEA